jgi:hypothetical protein
LTKSGRSGARTPSPHRSAEGPVRRFATSAGASTVHEPPQGEVEEAVAVIWSELLGVENVGRIDGFFELVGHSLLAVQLSNRIQTELELAVPLSAIFSHGSIALSAEIIPATAAGEPIQHQHAP